MSHYAPGCPITLSNSLLPVPVAVTNEKYLNHSKSPPKYAPIRRKMPLYDDLAESVSELSESVEVA